MAVTLKSPIYLPKKQGYTFPNYVLWDGFDLKNLVDDLQALNVSVLGSVNSVNSGTDITVDNTDPANPIINFSGSSGGENINQTLTIGKDAGGLDILNVGTLSTGAITEVNPGDGLNIFVTGNSPLNIRSDHTPINAFTSYSSSPTTASVVLQASSNVGDTASIIADYNTGVTTLFFNSGNGDADFSGVSGVMIAGAGGIQVGVIGELVGGVGVVFPNDIHTDYIKGNGGNLLLEASNTKSVVIQNFAADTKITITNGGSITALSSAGAIDLTPNTGWTVCTGTENKAGFDSEDVLIFASAGEIALARSVAALQNILITKGYLVT